MKRTIVILLLLIAVLNVRADYYTARNQYNEEVGLEYFERGNYDMALPMLQQAAKSGSLPALNALGQMYENGLGVTADKTIMMNMYTKAVAGGHVPAIINLASYYYKNGNTPKAIELWEKGVKLGDPFCMMKMGRCYELGVGVSVDFNRAEDLYYRASQVSPAYKEDLASICYKKELWERAFKIYWEIYTSGEYLSDMGGAELAALLAAENSIAYRNPAANVTKTATSPVDMARELNLAKAAQVWLNKVQNPSKITGSLHFMTPMEMDWDKVLEGLPEVKARIDEYNLAEQKIDGGYEVFPMSRLSRYPEMIGGDEKFADWVCYNMRYPVETDGEKAKGRVVVAGIVGYDGKFSNPVIIKSGTPGMNREALRLASNMPLFTPGGISTNCRSYFAVPIVFNPDSYAPWRKSVNTNTSSDEICTNPDTGAEFPGGQQALYRWLGENLRYPPAAVENNIQGRVVVSFVIEKDGSIGKVTVIRYKDPDLDKEAIRLIKSMPRWTPAQYNGQPVRSQMNIPITFSLSR